MAEPGQGGRSVLDADPPGRVSGPNLRTNGVLEGAGRGERDSPATNDLPITMRLAEPPEQFDWLRCA